MDPTESMRSKMSAMLNSSPRTREELEQMGTQVWDTSELQRDFKVICFAAPFVIVERKSDGVKGSLVFQHSPRFYFAFEEA